MIFDLLTLPKNGKAKFWQKMILSFNESFTYNNHYF